MSSSSPEGYVVSQRFAEAFRVSADTLSDLGSRNLTPVEQAIFEYVTELWRATAQAVMELEVRVGPTQANPAGHAALKAFAAEHGINID
jgi:hypothetical protein